MLEGNSDVKIPTGIYKGTYETQSLELKSPAEEKLVTEAASEEALEKEPVLEPKENSAGKVNITIFPADVNSSGGNGILELDNRSQRFYWKADGDNKSKIWNLLFKKDNNIYTQITEGFNFTGSIQVTDTKRILSGTLITRDISEESEKEYFLSAFQYINPEIIIGKEAPGVAAGETLILECMHCGSNPEALVIKATNNMDNKSLDLKIDRIEKNPDDTPNKLIIKTEKELAKGEYSAYIVRDELYESHSFLFNIL